MVINMKKHAIVNTQNIVENIILWDGTSEWKPPEGHILVNVDEIVCDIGWIHNNGNFSKPPPESTEEV